MLSRPMMAFMGVRISWLMLDRKLVLARLDSSARIFSRSICFSRRWMIAELLNNVIIATTTKAIWTRLFLVKESLSL